MAENGIAIAIHKDVIIAPTTPDRTVAARMKEDVVARSAIYVQRIAGADDGVIAVFAPGRTRVAANRDEVVAGAAPDVVKVSRGMNDIRA